MPSEKLRGHRRNKNFCRKSIAFDAFSISTWTSSTRSWAATEKSSSCRKFTEPSIQSFQNPTASLPEWQLAKISAKSNTFIFRLMASLGKSFRILYGSESPWEAPRGHERPRKPWCQRTLAVLENSLNPNVFFISAGICEVVGIKDPAAKFALLRPIIVKSENPSRGGQSLN